MPIAVDEQALVAALRAGSEVAFETMVRVYGGRLLSVARRITRHEEDARDVVQSAYLNAFRALGRFEGGCQLSTWLHRITVNTALMRLRSQRRRSEESIETLLPAFLEDVPCSAVSRTGARRPISWSSASETRTVVRACIRQLPDNYREVLILRDIEELSTEEVAQLLSTTQAAIKVRLHRARQALSTLLRRANASTAITSRRGDPGSV